MKKIMLLLIITIFCLTSAFSSDQELAVKITVNILHDDFLHGMLGKAGEIAFEGGEYKDKEISVIYDKTAEIFRFDLSDYSISSFTLNGQFDMSPSGYTTAHDMIISSVDISACISFTADIANCKLIEVQSISEGKTR